MFLEEKKKKATVVDSYGAAINMDEGKDLCSICKLFSFLFEKVLTIFKNIESMYCQPLPRAYDSDAYSSPKF